MVPLMTGLAEFAKSIMECGRSFPIILSQVSLERSAQMYGGASCCGSQQLIIPSQDQRQRYWKNNFNVDAAFRREITFPQR